MKFRWLVIALVVLLASCKDEKEPGSAPVSAVRRGLEAVPAEVTTVMVVDVAKVAAAPLARRTVGELLSRDPELAGRIATLLSSCKLELGKELAGLVIAMGEKREDSLLVASGIFDEASLAACVGKAVAAAGGELTQTSSMGHTVYRALATDDAAPVFFVVGRTDSVLVASSRDFLDKALGEAPKLSSNRRLGELLSRAERDGAVWGMGLIPADIGAGLVGKAGLRKPPQALVVGVHLEDGLRVRVQVEMVDGEDANSLVTLAKPQLETLTWVAHKKGLSELIARIEMKVDARWVELVLNVPQPELGEILARLHRTVDSSESPQQNPPAKQPRDGGVQE